MTETEAWHRKVRGSVQEETCLLQILFDEIQRIDLRNGAILQRVNCPNTGGLIGICTIEDGYILHGETELFRYDKQLNRVWEFSGRDIFATPNGEKAFWLEKNSIHCRDWLGWHYVLDLDGNPISEILEMSPHS